MTNEQAKAAVEREGWTLLDLYSLVEAFAASTSAGFDIKGRRVHIVIKKLPLRKPAKKVKK